LHWFDVGEFVVVIDGLDMERVGLALNFVDVVEYELHGIGASIGIHAVETAVDALF